MYDSIWSAIAGPVNSGDLSICNTDYGGLCCNNYVEAIDYTAYCRQELSLQTTIKVKRTQH